MHLLKPEIRNNLQQVQQAQNQKSKLFASPMPKIMSKGNVTTLLENETISDDLSNLHELNIDPNDLDNMESNSRSSIRSTNSNNNQNGIFDPNPNVIDRRIATRQQTTNNSFRERSMNYQKVIQTHTVRPLQFNITQTPQKMKEQLDNSSLARTGRSVCRRNSSANSVDRPLSANSLSRKSSGSNYDNHHNRIVKRDPHKKKDRMNMLLQENNNYSNSPCHQGVEIKTAKKVNVSTTRGVYRGTSSSMEQSSKGSGDIRFTSNNLNRETQV